MRASAFRRLGLVAVLAILLLWIVVRIIHDHGASHSGRSEAQLVRQNGQVIVADNSPLMRQLYVEPVRACVQPHGLRVPGMVQAEPTRSINVLTPVTGRVINADFMPGQIVHKGDVLAVLASGDLDQAYSDMLKARAQEAFQARVVKRAQEVLSIGGNAHKDLDSAANDLAQAKAERQRAERRLESLNSRADKDGDGLAQLVAPSDGLIASTTLAAGANITDNTAVLAVLLDISKVQIEAGIPEDSLAVVKVGQQATARIDALPGKICTGLISSIDPMLHSDSRRGIAHILCDNPDGAMRPNMFAEVEIAVEQPKMAIIPKTALLMNNDDLSVFVQDGAPGHFRRRQVTVSYDEGNFVRVLSGLHEGDSVVTRGAILLNDND